MTHLKSYSDYFQLSDQLKEEEENEVEVEEPIDYRRYSSVKSHQSFDDTTETYRDTIYTV